jgi:hypothetical protein
LAWVVGGCVVSRKTRRNSATTTLTPKQKEPLQTARPTSINSIVSARRERIRVVPIRGRVVRRQCRPAALGVASFARSVPLAQGEKRKIVLSSARVCGPLWADALTARRRRPASIPADPRALCLPSRCRAIYWRQAQSRPWTSQTPADGGGGDGQHPVCHARGGGRGCLSQL